MTLPQPISLDKIIKNVVLVRVSFDVPNLDNLERIKDALPTLKQLLEQKNKLILVTKWGKVKELPKPEQMPDHQLSTSNLLPVLQAELSDFGLETKPVYVNQFASPDFAAVQHSQQYFAGNSNLVLLENAHFDPREKSKNSQERLQIAGEYAKLANFVVDEAFASSHRLEATNAEIKTLRPFALGLSYTREVANLEKLKKPKKPFVVLMGGAKLETKLPLLQKMLPISDQILVAGLLAFTFIKAAKLNAKKLGMDSDLPEIFDSFVEENFVPQAQELLLQYPEKIILPVDFVYDEIIKDGQVKKLACDIGHLTITKFVTYIQACQSLFWNGPMGFFEKPPFDKATHQIAQIITESQCFSVLGGGDTNAALGPEILAKFSFVSMAGGATLDFLSR